MAVWPVEMAEMAMKPLLMLLPKHSLGGCTTDRAWQYLVSALYGVAT